MTANSDKLLEGIAYFEQVLQMMPDDRATLEFLCIAYEQTGNLERYRQVLVSLAGVIARERDSKGAAKLLESLEKHDEPEIRAAALKIRAMLSQSSDAKVSQISSPAAATSSALSVNRLQAVKAELALVSWMESSGIVERELADKIRDQLEALSSVSGDFLISALAILENENPGVAEYACSCVADECHVPPIAVEAFESALSMARELPDGLAKTRGAIVFGKVADEMLVALANPMDKSLMREIAGHFGGKCHFYFAPPLSVGIVLGKLFPESKK